jgi:hypothetical protein
MATNNNSKIVVSGITGNQNSVTNIKNITMIGKKGGCSDQHDDIDIALIRNNKNVISDVDNVNMVGADYTESNANSASGAYSRQSPTNVKT